MARLALLALSGGLAACAGTSNDGNGGSGGLIDIPTQRVRLPPPQGASVFTVQAVSPAVAGKICPVSSITVGIPEVAGPEALDGNTYRHKIVAGEDAASVSCKVSGATSFSFAGAMQLGSRGLELQNGELGVDLKGFADMRLTDETSAPSTLSSSAPCIIDASSSRPNNLQVKPGSIWASFNCASVEAAPSDFCQASGFFVLENCER